MVHRPISTPDPLYITSIGGDRPPHTLKPQMTDLSALAAASSLDLLLAETRGEVKVTRLPQKGPRKADLVMTQTKGNRCRTNRSSGTNFVSQAG